MSMEEYHSAVEEALNELNALRQASDESVTVLDCNPPESGEIPQPLRSAMRYSLLLPGKRLRPSLLLAAYGLVKDDWRSALPFACALEMIHTYSLIHDDLPAMDNDDLRRGKPTNHKVFGDGMAILAGDGLLNMAYETMLSSDIARRCPVLALKAAGEIASRAGVTGMIAGQALDVALEGTEPREKNVHYIHLHKTADLIIAPMTAGLMLAGASDEQVSAGRNFGRGVGLAFQIVDDLLDLEGDVTALGKQTGMDAQRGKQTWPAVKGIEQSREDAREAVNNAVRALSIFGDRAKELRDFALKTLVRAS